jgi:hypothetical protein
MKFTKEMVQRFGTAIAQDTAGCKTERRWSPAKNMWQYHYTLVNGGVDRKGNQRRWQFTITVPERCPEEFEVHGHPGNPGYTNNVPLQRARKEEVTAAAGKEMYKLLEESEEWQEERQALWDEYAELHGG